MTSSPGKGQEEAQLPSWNGFLATPSSSNYDYKVFHILNEISLAMCLFHTCLLERRALCPLGQQVPECRYICSAVHYLRNKRALILIAQALLALSDFAWCPNRTVKQPSVPKFYFRHKIQPESFMQVWSSTFTKQNISRWLAWLCYLLIVHDAFICEVMNNQLLANYK